ncbi:MFS transporter [Polymorphobacter sp.]|uniref:MFS transporter n=1 Tax=Polymorphobacter sp. TaxID=1909290 RepID=UPI003F71A228
MSQATATQRLSADDPLPTSIKVSWGAGALGMALLMNSVGGLILFYLTTIVGMSGWIAGLLLSGARIFDALNDPAMGWLSDRTPEKYGGRRRPYLLLGGLLCALAMVLAFNVPKLGTGGNDPLTIAYVAFALVFYGIAYTVFNIPFIAMPAEMTNGYHERSSIHGWRVIFASIGITGAGAGAGLLLGWLSTAKINNVQVNTQADYTILATLYGAIILIACLTAWRGTKRAPQRPRTISTMPMKEQFASFFRNRAFLTIMGVKCFQLIAVYSSQAATFFMVVEVLQRSSSAMALIGLPMVATSFVATPLLLKFAKRVGKRGGYMTSALFVVVSYLSWIFAVPGEPDWLLVMRGVLVGVGFAGNVLFAMSMVTDAIEWDNHQTGLRREGMYTAVFSFVEKMAGAIGPAVVGFALSYAGFSATSKATPESYESVRQAALTGVAYVPAVCALVSVLLLLLYKLDEATLTRSRAAAALRDAAEVNPA